MEKTLSAAGHKCPVLYFIAPGVPVVFLHGLSYTFGYLAEYWGNGAVN